MSILSYIKNLVAEHRRKKELAKAPTDLEAALDELDRQITPEAKAEFLGKSDPKHPGGYLHFFGGMNMRNSWGLWEKEQPLTKWFRDRGIWHADDMSAIIYKAYWFRLKKKPFDILKESDYYCNYWYSQGIGFDGVTIPSTSGNAGMPVVRKFKKRGTNGSGGYSGSSGKAGRPRLPKNKKKK